MTQLLIKYSDSKEQDPFKGEIADGVWLIYEPRAVESIFETDFVNRVAKGATLRTMMYTSERDIYAVWEIP